MKTKIEKVSGIVLIITGFFCISYFIFGLTIGLEAYFGCALIALSGMAIAIYGFMLIKNIKLPEIGFMRVICTLFRAGLTIFLVSFIIIESLIIGSVLNNPCPKADYLIVEGAAIRGENPSLELYCRLQKAVQYLKVNPGTRVVVSGGQGTNETITEAEAMKRYLLNHGIAGGRIIKEENSTSTFENLKFSKQLMDASQAGKPYSIVIVTNDFHVFRSKFLAKRLGLKACGYPAPTPFYVIPNHYVREYFAVLKSFLIDRVS